MSRVVKFTAREVAADDGDFALTVGFARDSRDEQTDDGLMFQRAKEDDPDDEGIYVEVPIQRYACYDGVAAAKLGGDRFSVSFTAEAVPNLGGIAGMEISFALSAAEFERLAAMLKRIFRDHEAFTVDAG